MTTKRITQSPISFANTSLIVGGIDAGIYDITHHRGDIVHLTSTGKDSLGTVISEYESVGSLSIRGDMGRLISIIESLPSTLKVSVSIKKDAVLSSLEADFVILNKSKILNQNEVSEIKVYPTR